MPAQRRAVVLVLFALTAVACRAGDDMVLGDGGPTADATTTYPPPVTDLVPAVGGPGTVDLATWNVENFPKLGSSPKVLADLIASLDLDLVAIQEIESIAAFDELVARLPDHEGVLSGHAYGDGTFQKLAFVYRADLLTVSDTALLFQNNGYEFPRPPLQTRISVIGSDLDFIAITVHLKAGFSFEDRERRLAAGALLEGGVASLVGAASGDDQVIVLGDFNEDILIASGQEAFAPWFDQPQLYTVHTSPLADDGQYSFVPSKVLLDHVITTAALAALVTDDALINRLDLALDNYSATISDHLPVVIRVPIQN